jgi:hypothetical protein
MLSSLSPTLDVAKEKWNSGDGKGEGVNKKGVGKGWEEMGPWRHASQFSPFCFCFIQVLSWSGVKGLLKSIASSSSLQHGDLDLTPTTPPTGCPSVGRWRFCTDTGSHSFNGMEVDPVAAAEAVVGVEGCEENGLPVYE